MMRLLRVTVPSLVVLASGSGCATIVSTAISPVTGTVDAVHLEIEDFSWNALWQVPVAIVFSPLAGLLTGMNVDYVHLFEKDKKLAPVEDILRPWKHLPGH